jgi:Subtilase family
VDLKRVKDVVDNLKLLSSDIGTAKEKVPDIRIATVDLGPLLRWLVVVFGLSSENKVAIFEEGSAALIEGHIISDGRVVLEFETSTDSKLTDLKNQKVTDQKKRSAREIVDAVAYAILTSKLKSTKQKIDFGSWVALRDFVIGTKNMARLVSQPQPSQEDRVRWNQQVAEAAGLIERAGAAAQDWTFITLASFLFERSKDFDDAIRVLDRYAEFTRGDKKAEDGREARVAYLRDRRVESTVAAALQGRKGDGTIFADTATALTKLPSVVAARKLHRLDGSADRAKVKIAIVSGAKPHWFGLERAPEIFPIEEYLDLYGAQLAQVVRALSPSADVVFVPIARSGLIGGDPGAVTEDELVSALDMAANSDAPVILLPFGPLRGAVLAAALDRLMERHLVIVPAGNSGGPLDVPMATKVLVAEGVDLDGRRSSFSSHVKGALGAISQLPVVDLTETGPSVLIGTGTSYAAAALAAIAVESIARQPTLRGTALRDALIHAAAQPVDTTNPLGLVDAKNPAEPVDAKNPPESLDAKNPPAPSGREEPA